MNHFIFVFMHLISFHIPNGIPFEFTNLKELTAKNNILNY